MHRRSLGTTKTLENKAATRDDRVVSLIQTHWIRLGVVDGT
jgi:hypothetical protein